MKKFTIALAFMALTGCSSHSINNVKTYNDNFDGTKTVSIVPQKAECCLSVGAFWSAKNPTIALLPVKIFGTHSDFQSAVLDVDGKLYNLGEAKDSTSYTLNGRQMKMAGGQSSQQSTKGFVVTLPLVRSILTSEKTSIRVNTLSGGSVSSVINNGSDKSKAFTALQAFITAVDKAK